MRRLMRAMTAMMAAATAKTFDEFDVSKSMRKAAASLRRPDAFAAAAAALNSSYCIMQS
jgi:hypothetical protein